MTCRTEVFVPGYGCIRQCSIVPEALVPNLQLASLVYYAQICLTTNYPQTPCSAPFASLSFRYTRTDLVVVCVCLCNTWYNR